LLIVQGVRIDVNVFFFRMIEDLLSWEFGKEGFVISKNFGQDLVSSLLFALTQNDSVGRNTLRESGQINFLLFLFGWHRSSALSYIIRSQWFSKVNT
jgi:hypothetical protein